MAEKHPYELDFEQYIRNTEPEKKEKSYVWSTAIGLQQVDGLTPSKNLFDTAKRNIDGKITFDEAKSLIDTYYESKIERTENYEERTEEADKVASRIAQILSEKSFNFSPSHLIAIHGRLFEGIFKFAGKLRDYDISKREWVLDCDTVMYGAAFELKAAYGNTRTTAVFTIKYLHSLSFNVNNDIFAENSWYFRNALVRANYTNLQIGKITKRSKS